MATLTKNNPYDISPSGDDFFADSRNVEAVQRDIDAAPSAWREVYTPRDQGRHQCLHQLAVAHDLRRTAV
ncbi:MAG: hypothetical protein IKX61_05655 [Prevotella sp.]|nr:hypothetical protein [Prevotella sp.]